jgi:DNA modification methylase
VFVEQLAKAAERFFDVLKPGGHCAILIGDIRRNGKLYTLGFQTMARFQAAGFEVQDIVIKSQNKERSTEFYFDNSPIRLRISHEYLFIFRKPENKTVLESKEKTNV